MSPLRTPCRRIALFFFALALGACVSVRKPSPEVVAKMEAAADWQLAHPSPAKPDGWVQGAWYAGLSELDRLTGDSRYHDALRRIGETTGWKPGSRTYPHTSEPDLYHSDDLCVGQMYAEMYLRDRDPRMIAPLQERCDTILAHPKDDNLEFVGKEKNDRWSWCDSLFMAPSAWMRLYAATGNRAYLDYVVEHWWKTSDYLYDPSEHLYFRDSNFFKAREKNGRKIFWSRGNGWVLAGLARVLEYLPRDHPARPKFEQQFREIAARVRELQQPDGFWRMSLLDPDDYPAKETSGTGFFCFGLAWGINHGLLDDATYRPAVDKAWAVLEASLTPEGKLQYVQPIGEKPVPMAASAADTTEPYGVGAFLLAGAQVSMLPPRY